MDESVNKRIRSERERSQGQVFQANLQTLEEKEAAGETTNLSVLREYFRGNRWCSLA